MVLSSEAGQSPQICTEGNRWHRRNPETLFRTGRILEAVEDYIRMCKEEGSVGNAVGGKVKNPRGSGGRFPNLAGFCRYLGRGLEELAALGEHYPSAYDSLMTALEDAALNADSIPAGSATLTMAYFKRRLHYGATETAETNGETEGEIRVVFDHNMEEDGK